MKQYRLPMEVVDVLHVLATNTYTKDSALAFLAIAGDQAGSTTWPVVAHFTTRIEVLDMGDVGARRMISDDAAARRQQLLADPMAVLA